MADLRKESEGRVTERDREKREKPTEVNVV